MKCPKRCATSRGLINGSNAQLKEMKNQQKSLHRLKVRNFKGTKIKHVKKPPRAKDVQLLTHNSTIHNAQIKLLGK
jgi:hypothetical protein